MKEITLENLLDTEEHVSEFTAEMDTVQRDASNTANTLYRVADLVMQSDKENDLVLENLKYIDTVHVQGEAYKLRMDCRDYFKALVWLVKNTTICEQVAAKFHDTLKFNVERAAAKMLAEMQEYDS